MIEMPSEKSCRQPYPLSREEQAVLLKELPDHLAFLIPADFSGRFEDSGVKNGEERRAALGHTDEGVSRRPTRQPS